MDNWWTFGLGCGLFVDNRQKVLPEIVGLAQAEFLLKAVLGLLDAFCADEEFLSDEVVAVSQSNHFSELQFTLSEILVLGLQAALKGNARSSFSVFSPPSYNCQGEE